MMKKLSTQPLYLQVRDALAERIASGHWRANTTIPNEMELARELGISPGTTRKALDLLEDEGLITRKQGRGTFVNDPASPALAARFTNFRGADGDRIIGEIKVLDACEARASPDESERLNLSRDAAVYCFKRVRLHAGKAFLIETTVLPAELFPGLLERDLGASSLTLIANVYGILLGKAVETVSPGTVSASAAKALRIDEGTLVLLLDRVVTTRDGRFAEWRSAECAMSDIHYKVDVP